MLNKIREESNNKDREMKGNLYNCTPNLFIKQI